MTAATRSVSGCAADVGRIDSFLSSPEAPFKGARGLAVFSSAGGALFETIKLTRPVPAQVVISADAVRGADARGGADG